MYENIKKDDDKMKNIFKKLPQNARYNMLIRDIISSVIVLVIAYIIGIVINSFEVIPRVIKENSRYVFYISVVIIRYYAYSNNRL